METDENGNINFDNVILTPLERWVDTEFDFEQAMVERLNLLAKKSNQSVDNVVNHLLCDVFAEHLDFSAVSAERLRTAAEKCPYILLVEKGKAVARVEMIKRGQGEQILFAAKNPLGKDSASAELVADCERLQCEAAKEAKDSA